jgi:hypothetical protein
VRALAAAGRRPFVGTPDVNKKDRAGFGLLMGGKGIEAWARIGRTQVRNAKARRANGGGTKYEDLSA